VRANREEHNIAATFQRMRRGDAVRSGFNHFFSVRGRRSLKATRFYSRAAAAGIYARRLWKEDSRRSNGEFSAGVEAGRGIVIVPNPWLMPDSGISYGDRWAWPVDVDLPGAIYRYLEIAD